jgi:hypothetical protein
MGWLARAGDFSLLHSVQTGSKAHATTYSVGTVGFSPGTKAATVHDAEH